MRINQVAVVTKLDPRDLRKSTGHIHRETLHKVKGHLSALGLRYRLLDRNRIKKPLQADLILAVGGDGTVLAAAHFDNQIPILGINSAPETSTGFFCAADPVNFPEYLEKIHMGWLKPKKVPRLEVTVNGKKFPCPGLNDLLLASRLQGDTAHYRIRIGHKEELQKSSGVWVATGAGSTAVILSAGGKIDTPTSKRLQYRVREPFCFPKNRYALLHGFLKPGQTLTLVSEMEHGMIFIDGAKMHARVPKHAEITVKGGMRPLKIFL